MARRLRRLLDRGFSATLSIGLHLVLLLAATCLFIEKLLPVGDDPIVTTILGIPTAKFEEIETPRDILDHKGLPESGAEPFTPEAVADAAASHEMEFPDEVGFLHPDPDSTGGGLIVPVPPLDHIPRQMGNCPMPSMKPGYESRRGQPYKGGVFFERKKIFC